MYRVSLLEVTPPRGLCCTGHYTLTMDSAMKLFWYQYTELS